MPNDSSQLGVFFGSVGVAFEELLRPKSVSNAVRSSSIEKLSKVSF
jgi:hypothetical protein